MSLLREYNSRPQIPTSCEIMEDFQLAKDNDFVDPMFVIENKELKESLQEYGISETQRFIDSYTVRFCETYS